MAKANLQSMLASQLAGFADENITVGNKAKKLSEAVFEGSDGYAKRAVITISGAPIRYRYSGANANSSSGHLMGVGSVITLNTTASIKNFSAIRVGSKDSELFVTYES